jgi:hypothetical protein
LVAAAGIVVADVLGQDRAQVLLPAMSIRSVHSARTVRTMRSALAFILGAWGVIGRVLILIDAKTASNAAVNFASRSRAR